ncbi:MAG: archease [Candidatus Omnitrophica bacterium]|nr:archease [Candidatus Omnitrophota bacterium]
MWYVYILRCSDNSLYTGISIDPAKRLITHNKGKGYKYIRSKRPAELIYCEASDSKGKALRREIEIKNLCSEDKHKLVRSVPKKNYELIEHTADIGIRVKAASLNGLFKSSALAMFNIITRNKIPVPKTATLKKIKIKQSASDLEELFINWLNELLSLSSAKGLIFSNFRINKLDNNNLEAEVFGESIDNYNVNTEIKAATYHQLKLEQTKKGWLTEVIFDV